MRANLCIQTPIWSGRVRSSDPSPFWSRRFEISLNQCRCVRVGIIYFFPMIFGCSEETPFPHVKLTPDFNLNSEVC
jgi:hypothetical protein